MAKKSWNLLLVCNLEKELQPAISSALKKHNISHNLDIYKNIGLHGKISGKEITLSSYVAFHPQQISTNPMEVSDPNKMMKSLIGEPILIAQMGIKFTELYHQFNAISPAFQQSLQLSVDHIKEHYHTHMVFDVLAHLNNQLGIALVHDSALVGMELWISLKKTHTLKETAKRFNSSVNDYFLIEERGKSMWLEPPQSLLQDRNIPSSLGMEITEEDMKIVFGASTAQDLKESKGNTLIDQLKPHLKEELHSDAYASLVLDVTSLEKLLNNHMMAALIASSDLKDRISHITPLLSHISLHISQEKTHIKSTLKIIGAHESAIGDMIKPYTSQP